MFLCAFLCIRKCETISPFDDLAFDMYQDPQVAHIIRLLDQKKQDMVQQENFEEAKNLKQAIADLQKVTDRLHYIYIKCIEFRELIIILYQHSDRRIFLMFAKFVNIKLQKKKKIACFLSKIFPGTSSILFPNTGLVWFT